MFEMNIRGKSYKERYQFQLKQWVKGISIHNDVDDECCPDFSCCNPGFLADKEKRQVFKAVCDKGDEEIKLGMLMEFLGEAIASKFPDKNIGLIGGSEHAGQN